MQSSINRNGDEGRTREEGWKTEQAQQNMKCPQTEYSVFVNKVLSMHNTTHAGQIYPLQLILYQKRLHMNYLRIQSNPSTIPNLSFW